MKHIAAIALAACSLLASADEIGGDAIKTLREISGVELSEPWTNATRRIRLPKPIGPFSVGQVMTNSAGIVYQIVLDRPYPTTPTNEIFSAMSEMEPWLVDAFKIADGFSERRGRPEYVYGRAARLPNAGGWVVGLDVFPMARHGGYVARFAFWNWTVGHGEPSRKEGAAPATGDRGAAPVRASP